ncbi:MAG TPA: TonB-dependent receptor [Gemmatimonadales bacterium]|jgi:outer membrane receptor protein involved in Fe transport|nr:TonB-dependent receptor [Gemmatimonadales bacterium]
MLRRSLVTACVVVPGVLSAQQPTVSDSIHPHGDTLTHAIELQEITVTAAPTRREDPQAVITVTPTVISRTPATDAWDLVRQTAGVEVHLQGQGPGFAPTVSVRGFSSDHSTDMALWVDGVPINEPVNGHAEGYNDWNVLMPGAIEQMEVIKGPSNAKYGNFALAGAVNVRTIDRMHGIQGSVEAGSYGRVDANFLGGFDQAHWGGALALRYQRDGGWRPNSEYEVGQGNLRYVRDLSPSVTLDAGVGVHLTDWASPGYITADQFAAGQYDTVANTTDGGFKRRGQERVSLRVLANPNLLWRTTAYATQGRWQLYLTIPPEGGAGEGSGGQTEEEDTRYGLGLTSALTWALSRGQVTAGVEGRYDHSDYEKYFTTDRARDSVDTDLAAQQVSGGAFAQADLDPIPHLRVSIGGRYDALGTSTTPVGGLEVSDSKGIFSPKLGALVHLKHLVSLYANVSRGFRQTDGVIRDPSLPFITEWAYEAGTKLDGKKWNASVALFRADVSNEQSFDPITAVSTSGGQSRRQGVDLDLRIQPSPALGLTTAWTFTDAKYQQLITEDGDTLSGARIFNTARYVGTAAIDITPPKTTVFLRLATNVVGPYTPFDLPGVELPAYALVHLTGGIRFGSLLLQAGVRNLFDQKYPELRAGDFVSPGQPISGFGTVRYVW